MKLNPILKARSFACALALSVVSAPGIAQDYPQTIDNPSPSPEYEPSSQPPRTTDDSYLDERSGARGPIRSDDSMKSRDVMDRRDMRQQRGSTRLSDSARDEMARAAGQPGYQGFLWWRESSSNTP